MLATHQTVDDQTPLYLAISKRCSLQIIRALYNAGARARKKDIVLANTLNHYDALFFLLKFSKESLENACLADQHNVILLKLWYYSNRTIDLLKTLVEFYKLSTSHNDPDEGSVLHKCIQFPVPDNNAWVDYLLAQPDTDVNAAVVRRKTVRLSDAPANPPFR